MTAFYLDRPFVPQRPVRYLADECETVAGLFLARVARDPKRVAFRTKRAGGWEPTTWRRFAAKSEALATWLMRAGLAPGDKLCIVGSTRAEWCITDIAGQLAGGVTLGAYPTLTAEQLAYIIDHSDAVLVAVEGAEDLAKLRSKRDAIPKVRRVLLWDAEGVDLGEDGWVTPMAEALATPPDGDALTTRRGSRRSEDTAIIVYTSGTTGPPKGAMISHGNILNVLRHQRTSLPFDEEDVSFAFLPMAHVAERILGFYARIDAGIENCFASSIPKVLAEVKEVRPTLFGSVPRIFEKAYAKVQAQVEDASPARQRVFRWAEATGREVVRRWQAGERIPPRLRAQHALADRLVFSKLRAVFGGRVRHMVTGAAPIAPEILTFFWAAGFRVYEVYGMTESTVVTHANRQGMVRLGTVGKPLPYVEDRLAADGEILVRGPMVFQGYYKNEDATREAIDTEGWLHTGDIGERDADGYMRIRDRKKHVIITAGGKNLTPANIESELKGADPILGQVHVHGDRRPYLVALVTVGGTEALDWAERRGMSNGGEIAALRAALTADPLARPPGLAELTRKVTEDPQLKERVVSAVRKANARLARVETVKRVVLLDRELSVAEDELTPTLKVKRKNVEAKFLPLFDRLYQDASFGLRV
ncbi:MAG: long-chain fatty acid--CoA ligase [Myxococcota bacterium]